MHPSARILYKPAQGGQSPALPDIPFRRPAVIGQDGADPAVPQGDADAQLRASGVAHGVGQALMGGIADQRHTRSVWRKNVPLHHNMHADGLRRGNQSVKAGGRFPRVSRALQQGEAFPLQPQNLRPLRGARWHRRQAACGQQRLTKVIMNAHLGLEGFLLPG